MSLIQNRTMHPHLREDEALVIENAIRIAIDSIINVLYSVNSARTQEYQRMVADRDKEIQRIECRSKEFEQELQVLRQQGCTCRLLENVRANISGDLHKQDDNFEPSYNDSNPTIVQESDMNVSCIFAKTPAHISSLSQESGTPLAPSSVVGLEQSCGSKSSESQCISNETGVQSPSATSLVVKEEPSDIDTVLIKWEMSEQNAEEQQDSLDTSCQETDTPSMKRKLENRERIRRFREKLYADPDRHRAYKEGERLRNTKRNLPMSELPEETQRLKRAAWRAASRRYYARKVARQQAVPMPPCHLPQNTFMPHVPPAPLVDKRRRTLISELPEETQTLQREAWRAASRRYYARKMARLQADPTGLNHFLQNSDPLGGVRGQSRAGVGEVLWGNMG